MKPDITEIRKDREINLLIEKGNEVLRELGYTEHSRKHAAKAAETAGMILKELGYKKRTIELAKIAGYMHDIGNSVNRHDHAHSGAILAYGILKERNMELEHSICSLMDYFEIFLERMIMCKRAAECLNCRFRLVANGSKLC